MRITKVLTTIATALALLIIPAAAQARDRDHDGLPDKWEKRHHLSTKAKSANGDPDRDRVDNRNELREGTNPRRRDSDRDGRPDGREDRDRDRLNNAAEDATGNDPADPDTDNDGVRDGAEQAGTIKAIEGSLVTIDLANGDSITGELTDATELTCESEGQAEKSQARHRRGRGRGARSASEEGGQGDTPGDGPGDTPGDGAGDGTGDEPGDDNGGDNGDDQGDDNGGDQGDDNGGETGGDDPGAGADAHACPPGALRVGARVREASLDLGPDGGIWTEISLLRG
jgi:hypothetical protein